MLGIVGRRISLLPVDDPQTIVLSKEIIHQETESKQFLFANANRDDSSWFEQSLHMTQASCHKVDPVGMSPYLVLGDIEFRCRIRSVLLPVIVIAKLLTCVVRGVGEH